MKDEIERRLGRSATVAVGKQRTAAMRKGTLPRRWNPEPEDVQKSVAQLVLTIVEFLRRLMERQAIRRMEQKTLTKKEVEAVGAALMTLEQTVRDIGKRFGLTPEDMTSFLSTITCPTLLFWGRQSFARDPEDDPQAQAIHNRRIVKVDRAGHWLHHDQLEIFLSETRRFLAE